MKRLKILFVVDKWWAGVPYRPSAWHHTLLGSFRTANMADCDVVFYDEEQRNGGDVDRAVDDAVNLWAPDAIIYIDNFYRVAPSVSPAALRRAKDRGVKIVRLWCELSYLHVARLAGTDLSHIDLHIYNGGHLDELPVIDQAKTLWLFHPVDPSIRKPHGEYLHDVAFIGNIDRSVTRRKFVNVLRGLAGHGLRVYVPEQPISLDQYFQAFATTKIICNFSWDHAEKQHEMGERPHLTGRPFEVSMAGAMLFDTLNPYTSAFFTPGKEYVGFTDISSFVGGIAHYATHDKEREQIAEAGHRRWCNNYAPKNYWGRVIERLW